MAVMKACLVLCVSAALALPFEPHDGGVASLADTSSGLMPDSDDKATIEAEINQGIQHDVDMAGSDVGESAQSIHAIGWEKRTIEAINGMSHSEIAHTKASVPDKVTEQFKADAKQAEAVIAGKIPKKHKQAQTNIEQAAAKALKSPETMAKLQKIAPQAELEMQSTTLPVSFIDEASPERHDLGDDDFGASHLKLMGGSDADVEKAINAQIGDEVTNAMGDIPVNTMKTTMMKTLEEDKEEAKKFLEEQQKPKVDPSTVTAQLAAAQKAMESAEAADKSADEDGDEKDKAEK